MLRSKAHTLKKLMSQPLWGLWKKINPAVCEFQHLLCVAIKIYRQSRCLLDNPLADGLIFQLIPFLVPLTPCRYSSKFHCSASLHRIFSSFAAAVGLMSQSVFAPAFLFTQSYSLCSSSGPVHGQQRVQRGLFPFLTIPEEFVLWWVCPRPKTHNLSLPVSQMHVPVVNKSPRLWPVCLADSLLEFWLAVQRADVQGSGSCLTVGVAPSASASKWAEEFLGVLCIGSCGSALHFRFTCAFHSSDLRHGQRFPVCDKLLPSSQRICAGGLGGEWLQWVWDAAEILIGKEFKSLISHFIKNHILSTTLAMSSFCTARRKDHILCSSYHSCFNLSLHPPFQTAEATSFLELPVCKPFHNFNLLITVATPCSNIPSLRWQAKITQSIQNVFQMCTYAVAVWRSGNFSFPL